MKKYFWLFCIIITITIISSCSNKEGNNMQHHETYTIINESVITAVVDELVNKYGKSHQPRIEKGVRQIAELWICGDPNKPNEGIIPDGTSKDFNQFCIDNFVADASKLKEMFNSIQMHFETIYGHFNKMSLDLKRPVHLNGYSITSIDEIMAGYEPSANFMNDFYQNKMAFLIALNFPYYTLKEKEELGKNWTRLEWAYSRLGDIFTTRIPPALNHEYSESIANADYYISNYNICMGYLVDESGKKLWPEDMKLITHWNLRDEIKSLYAEVIKGNSVALKKQKMILDVMLHIIKQDIPKEVINSDKYTWNPISNKLFNTGKEIQFTAEPDTRYQHLLNNFKINKKIDPYRKTIGDAINYTFDFTYEMPQPIVEKMYIDFISSPQVKEVAALIKKRLGRDFLPFDIWYDGFKMRSSIDADMLTKKIRALYPNTESVEKDIPNILTKLGFAKDKAVEIASRIAVDASKGAGHAWGADMKGEKAHLRTRIGDDGMDYKGYNIAIHELGHNVEQTLSLYDVDNWFMRGVPNTSFTEAWAFSFQSNDLKLLDIKTKEVDSIAALEVLDKFWSCYEIMGVSLVDQRVWKWMYENPNCNAKQLKEAVIDIAIEIWNNYYAPIFNIKDCPILAIYSHMIDYPLYLSAYPLGHLIEFQMAQYIKDKNLGTEMIRTCTQGRLLPDMWMQQAVGSNVSIKPLLDATKEAVKLVN